jgi:signal transduction histidine kinase
MKKNNDPKLTSKIWKFFGGVSVRMKIFGFVLTSSILLSSAFVYHIQFTLHEMLELRIQEQGVSITRDIAARAADLILVNDLFSLHELLVETITNYPDVRYGFIMDSNNQILAHTFGDGFPLDLIDINTVDYNAYQNSVAIDANGEKMWDIAVPIFGGEAGIARLGISDEGVHQSLSGLVATLAATLIAVLLGSLLAATFLTWVLTRPILTLVDASQKIAQGDFSPRVERWADDEIGDLAVAFNQMTDELKRMEEIRFEREQLRKQLLEGVITAQEEERQRIARELHDSTSQSLTSVMIGLRNFSEVCDNQDIHPQIEQMREETGRTLEEIHSIAVQLRPAILDDLGLEAAISRLVQEWQKRTKIPADSVVYIGEDRLPSAVETALYRIVQEGLANISRHSKANNVSLLIERRENDVVAIIEDDGIGFDPNKLSENGRLGLLGMRERAELLNGNLTIESQNQKGTSIFITIPMASSMEVTNA